MKLQVRVLESGGGTARAATRGLFWLLAQMAGGRATSFVSQIVLARLLSPQDFGTIGLTYTVTTIIGSLTFSGIENVLLQRSRTFHIWAWPGFWIEITFALTGAALVLFLAPVGAKLYAAPEITGLASVLALAMPFSALSTIPMTAIRASLNFRLLAMIGTTELVASQILSMLLAWYGMGPYSFVIPVPIVAAVKTIWLWATVRPRMHRARPRRAWWYLIKSGTWVWGFRLLFGLIGQADYFVLGLLASRQEVGFYFFAFRLSFQPLEALAGNFWSVMFPVLAQLRSRPQEQCRAALKASESLAAAIFFAGCLQAALAGPVLHLMFHERWDGSIPLIQALSLALAFDAVPWISGALLEARGEFRTKFIRVLLAAPWFFILVGLGAWIGHALGVAIAVGVYYAIYGPCYSYFAMRGGGVGLSRILRLYILPLLMAGLAVLAARALSHLLYGGDDDAVQIVLIVVLATAFYAGLLRLCMPETFSTLRIQAIAIFSRAASDGVSHTGKSKS